MADGGNRISYESLRALGSPVGCNPREVQAPGECAAPNPCAFGKRCTKPVSRSCRRRRQATHQAYR
jgi:hypothetical protein